MSPFRASRFSCCSTCSAQTLRNQLDDQEHGATQHHQGEKESGFRHPFDEQPRNYICKNVNGSWNEAVEVDISLQITSVECETNVDQKGAQPTEI